MLGSIRQQHVSILDHVDSLLVKLGESSGSFSHPGPTERTLPGLKSRPRYTQMTGSPSSQCSEGSVLETRSMKRKKSVHLQYEQTIDRCQRRRPSLGRAVDSHITRSVSMLQVAATSRWSSGCYLCEAVAKSQVFNSVVFGLILVNAAFIGYEVNMHMAHSLEKFDHRETETSSQREAWMNVSDVFLNIFFILELALRVGAHQGR